MSALAAICARGSPGRPRGASPCPRFPREALGPHAAELVGAGQSAASQAPSCSMELPAPRLTFSPFTPAALLPGLNVSRSCTDEGWTHLEPGPYPIACGSNDKGSAAAGNVLYLCEDRLHHRLRPVPRHPSGCHGHLEPVQVRRSPGNKPQSKPSQVALCLSPAWPRHALPLSSVTLRGAHSPCPSPPARPASLRDSGRLSVPPVVA